MKNDLLPSAAGTRFAEDEVTKVGLIDWINKRARRLDLPPRQVA